MEEEVKKKLRETWSAIADSWTHLRARPLPEVIEFCSSIEKPGLVLDIACGNCRNLIPFLERGFSCVGFDFSKSMVREAKNFLKRKNLSANLLIADVTNLPFKEKAFDYVIFTRALHHIPTKKARIETLNEVKRTIKEKGEILITVWRRFYPQFLTDFFSNIFEKKFEFGDTYKKWTYHGKVYKRFYHLYSEKEFESELKESKLKIKSIFKDNGNIIARCEV
jgi:ubiquinone/menaquinone biosynthesis C-methylase UbiE